MINYLKYKSWYKDIELKLKEIYKSDFKLMAGLMASTSPRYSIKRNLKASIAIYQAYKKEGQALINYLENNKNESLKRFKILLCHYYNTIKTLKHDYTIKAELELNGLKVNSFYNNLIGNYDFITIDTWILTFFRHKTTWINKTDYKKYSNYIKGLARKEGLKGAEFQAVLWIKTRADYGFNPINYTDFLK